jgi:exodeoxyribonuclease I
LKSSFHNTPTFFWHDYETTGISKQLDRPTQFAGVRTDIDFNIIDDPLVIYCKPSADCLVNPQAALVTSITPQECLKQGIRESDFAKRIEKEMAYSKTCSVGYNSISYDDEITRHMFYRNFINPYEREYANGNSRWDIFNVVKMFSVLRPEGIQWPVNGDGKPSLKLEHLAKANDLKQERAHDALSDVLATIDLAKLLKRTDPELFNYCLTLRDKNNVAKLVNLDKPIPFLHIGSHYKNGFAVLYPLIQDSLNKNSVLCAVISEDISFLKEWDYKTIAEKLYMKNEDRAENEERMPLQEISINKNPAVSSFNALRSEDKERLNITDEFIQKTKERYLTLSKDEGIKYKVRDSYAYSKEQFPKPEDPDLALYDGGFPSPSDRRLIDYVKTVNVDDLEISHMEFEDNKYNTLLFRYKARNSLQTLSEQQRSLWKDYCTNKFIHKTPTTTLTLDEFKQQLSNVEDIQEEKKHIITALKEWGLKIDKFVGSNEEKESTIKNKLKP